MQHAFAIVWGALMLAGLLAVSAPSSAHWFEPADPATQKSKFRRFIPEASP
jgi:hypothetical protein